MRDEVYRGRCLLHHTVSRVNVIPWVIPDDVNFSCLAEGAFVSFLYDKSFFLLSIPCFREEGALCSSQIMGVELCSLFQMAEYPNELFDFPQYRDLSSHPYLLFTHSPYISMDTWVFILYFGLYSNATLLLWCSECLAWDTENSFSWLLCPSDIHSSLRFVSMPLLSGTRKRFRLINSFHLMFFQGVVEILT